MLRPISAGSTHLEPSAYIHYQRAVILSEAKDLRRKPNRPSIRYNAFVRNRVRFLTPAMTIAVPFLHGDP